MDTKQIKKIDIHAHAVLFKEYYPPHDTKAGPMTMVSAEEVIALYDRLGIEKGVLLPISAPESQMSVLSSESCKFLVEKYPDRFGWFCNVDPRAGGNRVNDELIRLIEHYKSLGAKGVGEITSLLPADDPKVMNLFAACAACDNHRLVCAIHIYHLSCGYQAIVEALNTVKTDLLGCSKETFDCRMVAKISLCPVKNVKHHCNRNSVIRTKCSTLCSDPSVLFVELKRILFKIVLNTRIFFANHICMSLQENRSLALISLTCGKLYKYVIGRILIALKSSFLCKALNI